MSERIATFYHGTTVLRAKAIVTDAGFGVQRTFLALGQNRDLAEIFAHRTVSKHPNEGGPALVIVTMGETVVVPVGMATSLRAEEDAVLLRAWVPDLAREVVNPARAAGASAATIHQLGLSIG